MLCEMLTVGSRVKYNQGYLDCWNNKERAMYAAKRGVVKQDNWMSGVVLWDSGEEERVFFPNLEAE